MSSALARLKRGVLKAWGCADQKILLKGHPKHLAKRGNQMADLKIAIEEEYLSQSEDVRLPPHFVPSDIDPSLEPPSPMELDEDDEISEDQDSEDNDDDSNDDEEDASLEKNREEEKANAHAQSKSKKNHEKSSQKHRKAQELNISKDHSEERKNGYDVSNNVVKVHVSHENKPPLKRVHSDVSEEQRTRKKSKNEPEEEYQPTHKQPSPESKVPTAKRKPTELSSSELSDKLEKEIRWILENCPFEEMTTKTVRHLLQERLHMDLRLHKRVIKEAVSKVIALMEDEENEDSNQNESPAVDSQAQGSPNKEHSQPKPGVSPQREANEFVNAGSPKVPSQNLSVSNLETSKSPKSHSEAPAKSVSNDNSTANVSTAFSTECTKLKEMVKILESDGETTADLALKLKLLQDLHEMKLSSQMIIASKIGVAISRLRKSRHKDISQEAAKLRSEWRAIIEQE